MNRSGYSGTIRRGTLVGQNIRPLNPTSPISPRSSPKRSSLNSTFSSQSHSNINKTYNTSVITNSYKPVTSKSIKTTTHKSGKPSIRPEIILQNAVTAILSHNSKEISFTQCFQAAQSIKSIQISDEIDDHILFELRNRLSYIELSNINDIIREWRSINLDANKIDSFYQFISVLQPNYNDISHWRYFSLKKQLSTHCHSLVISVWNSIVYSRLLPIISPEIDSFLQSTLSDNKSIKIDSSKENLAIELFSMLRDLGKPCIEPAAELL